VRGNDRPHGSARAHSTALASTVPPLFLCFAGWYLDAYQAGLLYRRLGYVPEQNFASGVAALEPSLFRQVGCEWNRQLGSWTLGAGRLNSAASFPPPEAPRVLACAQPCAIVHFNAGKIKCAAAALAAAGGACAAWHAMVDAVEHPVVGSSSCRLDLEFGGVGQRNAAVRARAAAGIRQYWGGCCR